jgi:hypothetical protein
MYLPLNSKIDLGLSHQIPCDGTHAKWISWLSFDQRYTCNSISSRQCGCLHNKWFCDAVEILPPLRFTSIIVVELSSHLISQLCPTCQLSNVGLVSSEQAYTITLMRKK